MNHWGKHLIVDVRKANSKVLCGRAITDFSNRLVKAIDMKAYGSPQVVHFGVDNKKGWTLVQLIETSNITGHFCDDTKDFYLDVFSCKDYDEKVVVQMIRDVFEPYALYSKIVMRDAIMNTKKIEGHWIREMK